MKEKCLGIVGKFLGHDFNPVFDTTREFKGDPDSIDKLGDHILDPYYIAQAVGFLNSSTEKYVHSVCRRCGSVIKRNEEVS